MCCIGTPAGFYVTHKNKLLKCRRDSEFTSWDCYGTCIMAYCCQSESFTDGPRHFWPHNLLCCIWVSLCACKISKSFPCISSHLPWDRVVRWKSENRVKVKKAAFRFIVSKNSHSEIQNTSAFSILFLITSFQNSAVDGGKPECVLYTVVSEFFMTTPAQCYITAWRSTSWCVTAVIINLLSCWGGRAGWTTNFAQIPGHLLIQEDGESCCLENLLMLLHFTNSAIFQVADQMFKKIWDRP